MWFIFEGLDKSGKTTLEWAFLRATNFKHNVVDRGPVGYLVFDKVFNRTTEEGDREFIRQATAMNKSNDFFVVYCTVDADIAAQRLKENNEECPYNYKEVQKFFDENIEKYYSKDIVLRVDTGKKTVDECAEDIVNWFGGTFRYSYSSFIDSILSTRGRFNVACAKQRHHIVPRCVGGSNDEDNLIDLTRSEHIEAHRLLAKESPKNVRLQNAYRNMARVYGVEKLTEEQKIYLDNLPSQVAWNKGKHLTDEQKRKISEGTKKAIAKPEIREKVSKGFKGKHHTEETKRKISNTEKGRIISKEAAEKMVATKKQ